MALSENEYRVLNVLLKEPSLSYTEIANKTDLSVTSIRNLLFSLMDYSETDELDDNKSSIVSSNNTYKNLNDKKNHNLNFYGKLRYEMLDFIRYDFFISCSNLEQMKNFKKFCEAHPYTSFRARMHGGENGIYATFFIPNGTLQMLLYSLDILKENGIINNFEQIIKNALFYEFSTLKIEVFDVTQNRWNFKFSDFLEKFYDFKKNAKLIDYFNQNRHKSILDGLDKIDIMILNEWGYGAGPRKTKAEILNNLQSTKFYSNFIKDLKLNRYIISDHVDSLLRTDILEYIGISFDRRKIQIFAILFYVGRADIKFLNLFANFIKSPDFPFETNLFVGDVDYDTKTAAFTWWASFTPYLVSKFTEFLFENCCELNTYIVAYNTQDIDNYPLYHANFVCDKPNEGHWKDSIEECLSNPLKIFFNEKQLQIYVNNYSNQIKND